MSSSGDENVPEWVKRARDGQDGAPQWGAAQADEGQQWGAGQSDQGRQWGAAQADEGQQWGAGQSDQGQQWGAGQSDEGQQWGPAQSDPGAQWGGSQAEQGQQWAQPSPQGWAGPPDESYASHEHQWGGQQAFHESPYGAQPHGAQWQPGATPAGRVSGWGSRVGASLLDSLVPLVPILVCGIVGGILVGVSGGEGGLLAIGIALLVVGYLAGMVATIWNRIFRAGRTGQSLGKKWTGQYLIAEATGQPIGAGQAFLREICHILDGFLCIGYILAAFDDKTQTFADKIVSTVVVKH